jgi:outer membrane murein-binding lipoprotein Lpp
MKDPNRKLILLLWAVVGVLVVGSAAGGLMMVHKADDLASTNSTLSGDVSSLRNQLSQAKSQVLGAQATPTPSLTPDATPEASAAPNPSVTPMPQTKVTASPQSNR